MHSAQAYQQLTQQTLVELQKMILEGENDPLQKTINIATGLVGYNLEAPSKQLVPLMSPFRQTIPRKTEAGANVTNWKAITALSQPKATVAERAASSLFTSTVADKSATYKGVGLRGSVSREAEMASQGFDPALAKETANTLLQAMRMEEMQILGGNITALSTPGAPTVTERNAVGTVGAATYYVAIAAMTLPAANRVSIDRPADYDGTDAFLAGKAKTTFDAATDGCTVVGSEGNVTTTGADNGLKITWTAVAGAAAYGVFVGTTTGAANLKCECIITQTSVTLTSLNTGGAAGNHAGTSADATAYDGIINFLVASGSGAYVLNANDELTGANGEVVEIQDMFQGIWDNAKIGKFRLLVAGIDSRILTRLGVSQDSVNIVVGATGDAARAQMVQGQHVGSIMNAVTGDMCAVETLPWLAGGTVIALPTEIPYNDANADAAFDMVMGYDWERQEYAQTISTGPVFDFETRCWGVLRDIFPGGCGIIYNIFKG